MDLRLRPLRIEDETEALAAQRELAADGFPFLLEIRPDEPWASYVARLERIRRGDGLARDRVPATFLVAEVAEVAEVPGTIVGRSSIRHELTDYLRAFGGHIGYGVRPAHRRRGYAIEILRQSLIVARAAGVQRVLVTCDADNAGSARAIERCGGALEDVRDPGDGSPPKRRYWID